MGNDVLVFLNLLCVISKRSLIYETINIHEIAFFLFYLTSASLLLLGISARRRKKGEKNRAISEIPSD